MAIPTFDKTWQFNVNSPCNAAAGDATGKLVMYSIKSALTTFNLSPWTVWGSSDGAGGFGNGDAVDRWAATSNLIWANAGSNHSWIVLTQTGIAAKASLCIDLNVVGTPASAGIAYSPSAGFGTANGGADGSATARPTASDQVIVGATGWGITSGGTGYKLHVMQSTDGKSTRVISCTANLVHGIWIIDVPLDPIPAWTNPSFAGVRGGGVSSGSYTNWSNSTSASSKIGGVTETLNLTCDNAGGLDIEADTFNDDDSGEWFMSGIGLVSLVAGHIGRKGRVADLYFGSPRHNSGVCYAANNSRLWTQFDQLIVPWDGSIPLVS